MSIFTRPAADGATASATLKGPGPGGASPDVVVVGAGVFGAWTALALRQAGRKVVLVDAWGPAHSRSSSGGESRMTRGSYGADEVYTRMAWESLAEWKALSDRAESPLFFRGGVLFFDEWKSSPATVSTSIGGWICRFSCSTRGSFAAVSR